ncbi:MULTISPECIES: hypothetical protein [Leptolyngbya]|nr:MULTISPECIES: hypothetical protein [Leptolyngbya]
MAFQDNTLRFIRCQLPPQPETGRRDRSRGFEVRGKSPANYLG